jgi:hypothetical protein
MVIGKARTDRMLDRQNPRRFFRWSNAAITSPF